MMNQTAMQVMLLQVFAGRSTTTEELVQLDKIFNQKRKAVMKVVQGYKRGRLYWYPYDDEKGDYIWKQNRKGELKTVKFSTREAAQAYVDKLAARN